MRVPTVLESIRTVIDKKGTVLESSQTVNESNTNQRSDCGRPESGLASEPVWRRVDILLVCLSSKIVCAALQKCVNGRGRDTFVEARV